MSDEVKVAIIGFSSAVAVGMLSIATAIVTSYFTRKKVTEYHLLVNSRMDELLRVSKAASRAEGHAEGMKEEQDKK